MSADSEHVVPNLTGGWRVVRRGSARASRVFKSQADAVRYARQKARKERTDLFVHREDFTVQQIDSFGSDSMPARRKR